MALVQIPEPSALAATRRAIFKARPDQGVAAIKGPGLVTLRITPAAMDRVLMVLSRLLNLAETLGQQPRATDAGMILAIDDQPVNFSLEEKIPEISQKPAAAEPKPGSEGKLAAAPIPESRPVTPIRLSIIILENDYSGLRRIYSDRKVRKLEDMIPAVLAGFAEHTALLKDRRRANEERERERRTAEARRKIEDAFEQREKRRRGLRRCDP